MKTYCENPLCENRSVKEVPVSVNKPADQTRALCASCEEAYTWGVQHGKMTVQRVRLWVLAAADTGVISYVSVCKSKFEVEKSLLDYLRRYHGYNGKYEIKAAYKWLREHDEYLSVSIVQQDINSGE